MNKDKTKNGAEELRNIVTWMNNRDEYLNENKTLLTLIGEYNTYLYNTEKL
jgi:hypothetical protein